MMEFRAIREVETWSAGNIVATLAVLAVVVALIVWWWRRSSAR